jgi:hypothetical protein
LLAIILSVVEEGKLGNSEDCVVVNIQDTFYSLNVFILLQRPSEVFAGRIQSPVVTTSKGENAMGS